MTELEQKRIRQLKAELKTALRTARPGFVELAVDAMALHAQKNNDYTNGKEFASLGLTGRFCDICRKVNRLHTLIIVGKRRMSKESQRDTALDLAVYALLLAEDLERDSK
jgi:hypothetical protein